MIGIDSQVQQRMDQFRGRPQDLMQQYQMSRELIDLLALQKLKSEKDAAARSMMMQMQQNPQTVAAQREAELMGRTQQEVAQQVGGIAQLAEARKRQNLQRMASGAQPPVRMAQGGIARFQDGGDVEEDIPWYRRLSLFGRPLVRDGEFALIDRPIVREGELALGRDAYNAVRDGVSGIAGSLAGREPPPLLQRQVDTRMEPTAEDLRDAVAALTKPPEGTSTPRTGAPGGVFDLLGLMFGGDEQPTPQAEPPAEPPPEQYTGVGFGTPAAAASRTPADLRAEEEARVREALGQEGIMSAYQDMIRRQQELSGRIQNPREQGLDRLAALLRGGAGRSTFGMTGAGMSAGAAGERRRQNALAQQLLDKEFGLTKEQLGAQLGIGKEALESGRGVYADANAMAREVFRANADMALEAAKQAAEGRISQRELVEMAAELTPPPTPGEDPEDYQERLRAAVTALGNMTLQLRTTILPLAGSTSPDDFEVQ